MSCTCSKRGTCWGCLMARAPRLQAQAEPVLVASAARRDAEQAEAARRLEDPLTRLATLPPDDPRALLVRAIASKLAELGEPDLRVLAAIVDELPSAALVALMEAETDAGIESFGKKLVMPATTRMTSARALLLGAWDAWRRLCGLRPRSLRGVDEALYAARTGRAGGLPR